jgi:hypothetical protein
MARDETGTFRQEVLRNAELRQKLKDIDLLPAALRRQAALTIAEDEGFRLDGPGAEIVLAEIERGGRERGRPAEPLRRRPE